MEDFSKFREEPAPGLKDFKEFRGTAVEEERQSYNPKTLYAFKEAVENLRIMQLSDDVLKPVAALLQDLISGK